MNKVMFLLLVGFTAGILLAPAKGSVTRKKLNDGFDDLADKLDELKSKFSPSGIESADPINAISAISVAVEA